MLNGSSANCVFAISLIIVLALCAGESDAQTAAPNSDISDYDNIYPALSVDDVIRLAVAGNVLAQHELSSRFAMGEGVPLNTAAAARWYSLAVSRGFPGASSLDTLRKFPVRARGATAGSLDDSPTARLTLTSHNEALAVTVDASASSAATSIIRYVWSVESADGDSIISPPGNLQTTQIFLPETGLYYITVTVLDAMGRIGYASETLSISDPLGPEILPPPPTIPVPVMPLPGTLLETETLAEFSWNTVENASSYRWEFVDTQDAALSTPVAIVPADNCSVELCSLAVNIDQPAGANYQWQVRAENAAGVSEWSITPVQIVPRATALPLPPTLLSPNANALVSQGDVVEFIWTQDPHAVTWEFQFLDTVTPLTLPAVADLRTTDICSDGKCALSSTVDLPVGQSHTWRVRGQNSMGVSDWSVSMISVQETVTDIPGTFVLVFPVEDSNIVENTETTFLWTRAARATSYELALVDGTDSGAPLTIITVNASTCSSDTCSYTATPSLAVSDQHSWQVRAINTLGATQWVSTSLNITAEPADPAPAPAIVAPLAGASVQSGQSVSFQWELDGGALSYEFYLFDADNGPQPVVEGLLPATLCVYDLCTYTHVVSLPAGNSHSWHVRARYADIDSEWSDTTITVQSDTAEPEVFVVESTNVSGGGFQSDVTITDDGQTVYASADVSGVSRSSDGGLLYKSQNEGLQSTKVASLAISPDNVQILYAGTGDKGRSGGLFRSVDGGDTWALTGDGANARFAGNHSAAGDPVVKGHPRSNGDLIVVNPGAYPSEYSDDIVIAGTYKDGVRLFAQGGESEVSALNTAGFVRSVAHNLALPDVAYAAIQFADSAKNGIYRIDYSNLSAATSTLEFSARRPEGLTVLSNGHVYAAIGTDGIAKFDGSSWTLQNSQLSINNPNRQWTAVDGYVAGNQDIVYAGTNNQGGTANGDNYSSIWRTVDGGDSWSPLADAGSNIEDTVYGKTYNWWFRIDAFPQAGLGRKNSIVSAIDVARGASAEQVADDIIYVSGRGGIWKSDDGGDSWYAAINNLQATSNNGVAINPNNSDQIVLANTDYVVLETRTGFAGSDLSRDKPSGSESRAYDVVFDGLANEIILATGDRDTNNPGGGEVFVKSAAALGAPSGSGWTNTDLASTTATNDGRVRAVAYGYHNGNSSTSQTILAAVEGEGVFRHHNGTWSKSTGITIGATDRSNFVWPDNRNSGAVYLLDLSVGLYRSNDGGQSWVNIWPGMRFRNNDFYNTGYIAADDNAPTTLYLSIQGNAGSPIGTRFKVFRMDGANSGIFNESGSAGITDISTHTGGTALSRPGPLQIGPEGRLWLAEQQDSKNSVDAGLYVMQNPATDSSFTQVTTNDYRNAVVSPSGIDISSDGHIYISQNGGGVVKISIPQTID